MDTTYLMAANIVVWVVLGAYVLLLALGQKKLNTRIKHLELLRNDQDS
ncbi:MAG: CcmD family protein [Desulfovibrio sp.]|nr:MAG: CcmD family protein [Desulfovibrio sp.]